MPSINQAGIVPELIELQRRWIDSAAQICRNQKVIIRNCTDAMVKIFTEGKQAAAASIA
ncbi:MAG TPA: hypothetical protein VLX68_09875 [Chitinivibrionales bacterium]|nr:hypothetical protein [Chitinivibrionales bacterium]